jgi:YecR-like lipoprotein/PDZ domain
MTYTITSRTLAIFAISCLGTLCGCATQKTLAVTGGSRSEGFIELSYEAPKFEQPNINYEQGRETALKRCEAWNYSDAEALRGYQGQCSRFDTLGSCTRWLVIVTYQCTGAITAAVDKARPSIAMVRTSALRTTVSPAAADSVLPTGVQVAAPVVARVRLGVHCAEVTPSVARAYHLPNAKGKGLRVVTIEAGSVAQASGIRVGDVLLKYGDRSLNEISDLSAAIAATPHGAYVPVTVWQRAGGRSVVTVQF